MLNILKYILSIKDKLDHLKNFKVIKDYWHSYLGSFDFEIDTPQEIQFILNIIAMFGFITNAGEISSLVNTPSRITFEVIMLTYTLPCTRYVLIKNGKYIHGANGPIY